MAKKKDYAFLFEPHKWLEGTAGLQPEEKGIYIDLLCHQHQKGDLPNDTKRLARLVGLSESDFLPLWEEVKNKFLITLEGRLHNRKLTETVTERLTKSYTNKVTATLAVLVRNAQRNGKPFGTPNVQPIFLKQIKEEFNINNFKPFSTEHETKIATERLTEWFSIRLKSILINSINVLEVDSSISNLDTNNTEYNKGESKKKFNQNPKAEDFNGLPDIKVGSVVELISITKYKEITPEKVKRIWEVFKTEFLTGDKFYQNENAVYTHFTNWIKKQDFKNEQQFNSGGGKSNISKEDAAKSLLGRFGIGTE